MQGAAYTGALLVAVICTILGSMGYRGREQVVGIDLGTTFSVVAIKFGNGTVRVIPDWSSNKLLTPSVVHYFENGTALVGAAAIPYRDSHPADTIFNSKRFIGKMFNEVEQEIKDHKYAVISMEDESAGFHLASSRRRLTPIDVGKEVLIHMQKSIESFMGYRMTTAIICVPAKFGKAEVQSTKLAFERAGFKVLRIMEEPTAAAVAYGLHETTTAKYVVVFDLGGGTLDISLLWMNGDAVNVVGTAGDDHLGGSDFDHIVQKRLVTELPNCPYSYLGLLAEQAKIRLSDVESTTITCENKETTLTRETFHRDTDKLFDRVMLPLDKVLEEAMMEPSHVNDVVLVGGATRMPKIREMIRQYFPPSTPVHMDIDPDTTVAYGAANVY